MRREQIGIALAVPNRPGENNHVDVAARIAENLAQVRGQIAEAAARARRNPDEVRLVAVTKYVGPDEIAALLAAGCRDLGESRPQQLWERAEQFPTTAGAPVRWHLLGHLQTNKVRRTLPAVDLIHSVDSLHLAEAIDAEAARLGRPARVLIEVNVAGEAAKHGFSPEAMEQVMPQLLALPRLRIEGLMGMGSLGGGPEANRAEFAALRQLRDRLRQRFAAHWQPTPRQAPPEQARADQGVVQSADQSAGNELSGGPSLREPLHELSMGMSGDFPIAVEEGATIVRVGSALFEGLPSR